MGKIDRAALRQKIQQLEGLTDDERAALLELAATKRYGLVWEEREEDVEERLREELPVLVEDKDLALLDGGKDAPNHILIEGDNLEALTTLSYTHEGKVDVIYIDPPYNTGNKDFVYNDSFVDSEDSYRHSKWLSFMSKRLRIAKRLLSDRGVIFISIDDNEQANLKLLCDEVFGERNFRNSIYVRRRTKTLNLQFASGGLNTLNVGAEYILVYAKENFLFKEMRVQKTDTPSKGTWNVFWSNADRPSMRYDLLGFAPTTGQWRWSKELAMEAVINYEDYLKNHSDISLEEYWENTGCSKRFIRRIPNGTGKNGGVQYWVGPSDTFLRTSNWTDIEVSQIHKDFDLPFNNPKNVDLIREILKAPFYDTSTVLDFFAGSGTTLHAVMQLNKEDGGKRQCILVTNNENNICREVTYERNKRVIEGYTTPKGIQVEGLRENNLRYYRTHLLPRERTNRNMRRLVAASTDLLCIKEEIYSLTPWCAVGSADNPSPIGEGSRMLTQNDVRLFSDGNRAMMVIYNEEVIPDIVDWLQSASATNALTHLHNNAIKVYVFSPGAYAWDDDFAPVIDKVELCALPEAIYQAYKSVLPKKRVRRETVEGSPKEGGEE